jgi:hypothetical protein
MAINIRAWTTSIGNHKSTKCLKDHGYEHDYNPTCIQLYKTELGQGGLQDVTSLEVLLNIPIYMISKKNFVSVFFLSW